jgi:hypothetical protein
MAPDDIGRILDQFYTTEELVELLRDNMRYVSVPVTCRTRNAI